MILLITPSERASQFANALHDATGENVIVAENLAQATAFLRVNSYLAVIFDQHLLEAEPDQAANTLDHLGTAVPVEVNLAIRGIERLVREVKAALRRRYREEIAARQAALGKLQSELNCTVTALLLSVELAQASSGLTIPAAEKLQSVHNLVNDLRHQLEQST